MLIITMILCGFLYIRASNYPELATIPSTQQTPQNKTIFAAFLGCCNSETSQ
ncbi:hypothetical protein PR003_g13502 [Phytophthora rubi]|uniref:Uncharacterized protein n=1 Tax=Phytophthora rubi TaxID=129364 RepID=A0A6A3JFT0_9STRA|nr:hypothetical protein PR002_g20260 [Phytophthora rubi]KAE9007947.1 hypothetical protein PR001_g16834 [Phytophthora rubi]KAE9334481.1 hypothetical protein PR003_g13502 [Phytophthora rubi]